MKLTYDPAANVAYIRLRERQGEVGTISVTADFHVDIDATGAVCGIELLNANEQLTAGDDGKLIVVNDGSGEQGEMKVASPFRSVRFDDDVMWVSFTDGRVLGIPSPGSPASYTRRRPSAKPSAKPSALVGVRFRFCNLRHRDIVR